MCVCVRVRVRACGVRIVTVALEGLENILRVRARVCVCARVRACVRACVRVRIVTVALEGLESILRARECVRVRVCVWCARAGAGQGACTPFNTSIIQL